MEPASSSTSFEIPAVFACRLAGKKCGNFKTGWWWSWYHPFKLRTRHLYSWHSFYLALGTSLPLFVNICSFWMAPLVSHTSSLKQETLAIGTGPILISLILFDKRTLSSVQNIRLHLNLLFVPPAQEHSDEGWKTVKLQVKHNVQIYE